MNNTDLRLKIELVPQPLWGKNLRAEGVLGRAGWRRLRAQLLGNGTPVCGICGAAAATPEAHEEWEYIEAKGSGIARLKRISLVCQDCHSIHHIGRTQKLLISGAITRAMWDHLIAHFLRVNACDVAVWEQHSREVKADWSRRSKLTWTLDVQTALKEMRLV
jgi:hypothetical protein